MALFNFGKKKEEEKLGWQKSVLLYAHDMLYLLLIVMLLFLLVFRIIVVSGGSMRMTLLDGDYLLLLNNTFYHAPQRGDIVVISKESFDNGKPIVNSVNGEEASLQNILPLVKKYGAEDDYQFVNGLLGAVARERGETDEPKC